MPEKATQVMDWTIALNALVVVLSVISEGVRAYLRQRNHSQ